MPVVKLRASNRFEEGATRLSARTKICDTRGVPDSADVPDRADVPKEALEAA